MDVASLAAPRSVPTNQSEVLAHRQPRTGGAAVAPQFADFLRLAEPDSQPAQPTPQGADAPGDDELRDVFRSFVGETFFGQVLGAMRKTVGKPAYMHGGRAEEVFQAQLDQVLSEHMTAASAESFADPMFELFQLTRR